MPEQSFGIRLKHAWNAFRNRDPTVNYQDLGSVSYSRPDRSRRRQTNEQSIITAVHNRIATDVAAIQIRHVRVDEAKSYEEDIDSDLNYCLTTETNLDQTSRAFFQDVVMSMFDEGCIAVIPVETTLDPTKTNSYEVHQLRTGRIVEWYPQHVRVSLYNERTGLREELTLQKKFVAVIENPFFAIMNEQNGTLQRLIRKLNLLDSIDEQSGSGKLDLIIQLPYVIKSEARRQQAETRRKDIEYQLSGSKYGIAYTDGTERITQLNRPVENNLMSQIMYLTSMLYSQLCITEEVLNGTADEKTMLNYMSRTVEPIASAIVDEFERKFLTKTARTQRQAIMFFRDTFKLVPANDMANVADKYTRNEILTSNEIRAIIGRKPSKDPSSDELRNKNLNRPSDESKEITSDQQIQLFETLIKNPEAIDALDPYYKELLLSIIEPIETKTRKENNQNGTKT